MLGRRRHSPRLQDESGSTDQAAGSAVTAGSLGQWSPPHQRWVEWLSGIGLAVGVPVLMMLTGYLRYDYLEHQMPSAGVWPSGFGIDLLGLAVGAISFIRDRRTKTTDS